MKMIKTLLLFGLSALPLALNAQSAQDERVGVQTNKPTEQLHVKGTMRIETLPKKGEKITTGTDGSYDNQAIFTPNRVVVADANGVLGAKFAAWPLFFYMPSCIMPTDPTIAEYYDGTQFRIDLYERYKNQFSIPAAPAPGSVTLVSSPSAGNLPVELKTDLGYFVTYYDAKVFKDVKVDNEGILTYKLVKNPATVTEYTYMNIVFKRL